MILYHNGLIKLEYNPATDILFVDLPSVSYGIVQEFRHALDIIVENVRTYDVKKLLVDARRSVIEIDTADYVALVSKFSSDLKNTRLEKGARVVSGSAEREKIIKRVMAEVSPAFEFKTFTEDSAAEKWLSA